MTEGDFLNNIYNPYSFSEWYFLSFNEYIMDISIIFEFFQYNQMQYDVNFREDQIKSCENLVELRLSQLNDKSVYFSYLDEVALKEIKNGAFAGMKTDPTIIFIILFINLTQAKPFLIISDL